MKQGWKSVGWKSVGWKALAGSALLALACGGVCSCSSDPRQGYSFNTTFATNVDSVSVPIFQNTTFTRGVEVELTEAIVAELRKSTSWRIVQEETAQTTLRGTITSSELRKFSTARDTGLVEELGVEMTVDFEWKDNRTGKIMVARRGFTASQPFSPARGIGERIETGQHATVQELARDIVAELRSGW